MAKVLAIFISILILLSNQAAWGEISLDHSFQNDLIERKLSWPNWSLPGPFRRPKSKEDLIYPDFFLGDWQVITLDLNDPEKPFLTFQAKFKYDLQGRVVAARSFNAKSIGQKIFKDSLIDVLDDPDSSNRQLAIFQGGEYLETKIIGRSEFLSEKDIFISDELALQIFHALSTSRINQVETLSRYTKCNVPGKQSGTMNLFSICGEQWQAKYKQPGDSFRLDAINSNHFFVLLISPMSELPSKNLLIDLFNQKDQLTFDSL